MKPKRMTHGTSAAVYQLAAELLLVGDELTEGQRDRLTELLLNVLSEPNRYTGALVAALHRMAVKP